MDAWQRAVARVQMLKNESSTAAKDMAIEPLKLSEMGTVTPRPSQTVAMRDDGSGKARLVLKASHQIIAMLWIPEHGMLITADGGRDLTGWDVHAADKRWCAKTTYEIRSLEFLSSVELLISGDEGGRVTIWNLYRGTPCSEVSAGSMVMSVTFAQDLNAIICGCMEGEAVFLDGDSWEERSKIFCEDHLMCLCYAADLQAVLSADGQFCTVSVWDAFSGEKRQTMQCEDWATAVAYVPALKAVVSGDEGHKVTLWDAASGHRLWEVTCGGPVHIVSYERSLDMIIANDMDDMTMWTASSGLLRQRIPCSSSSRSRDGLRAFAYDELAGELIEGDFWGRISFWPARSSPQPKLECGTPRQKEPESRSAAIPAGSRLPSPSSMKCSHVAWPSEQLGRMPNSVAPRPHHWPSELGMGAITPRAERTLSPVSGWPSEQLGKGLGLGRSGWPSEQLAMKGRSSSQVVKTTSWPSEQLASRWPTRMQKVVSERPVVSCA